ARRRLLAGHPARPSPALAPGGLALVRGDPSAGDRAGPGRGPGHGRPLHLRAAHRPFIMLAWIAAEIVRRRPAWRSMVAASVDVLLAGCAAATGLQLRYWRSSMTLFEHAVEVIPDNYVAHLSPGNALAEQGRRDAAIAPH